MKCLYEEIENLRFGYEANLLRSIGTQFGHLSLLNAAEAYSYFDERRQTLLGDAVHITEDLLEDIYQAFRSCLESVGLDTQANLFVKQDKDYNANVFAHAGQFDLLLHSSLIQDFTLDQLRFIMGHEIGHVLFEHSMLSIYKIIDQIQEVPAKAAKLFLQWNRAAEISADRIGLYCCGNLNDTVTALFVMSSGITGIPTEKILRSFRQQYEKLEAHLRSGTTSHMCFRTHPMIPIRFKAIELSALDILALRTSLARFSWKSFAPVDRQIGILLDSLDAFEG